MKHSAHRALQFAAIAVVAALAFGGQVAVAQSVPTTQQQERPARPPRPASVALSGQVQGYNLSPRGTYDALLLSKGDKIIQVNFPPDAGGAVSQAAPIGQDVQVTATPELGLPDHPVYNLDTLSGKGEPITVHSGPGAAKQMHVDGVIKQLNYGRHGEVNGAVLESGDFVHIGPEAAMSLNLAVGQKLAADGQAVPMLMGHNAINAESVNGVAVPHHGPRDGADGPPDGGPPDGGPPMDGPGGPGRHGPPHRAH